MAAELGIEGELDVPDSVQGIIAARLDLLPPEEKDLLQNAAVVGKQFWTGAVSALGRSRSRSGCDCSRSAISSGARGDRPLTVRTSSPFATFSRATSRTRRSRVPVAP